MARTVARTNEIVAHIGGVRREVRSEAGDIASRARSRLSSHRRTGALHIETDQGKVDAKVSLVDGGTSVAAAAIEFGYTHPKSGRWVEGLNILRGAAGLTG